MFKEFNKACLSDDDVEKYIKAIIYISMADGDIHEKEKKYIDMQAQKFSVDAEKFWKEPEEDLSFLNESDMPKIAKLAIIRDCILIGGRDGYYDIFERQGVSDLANILGIKEDEVANVEKWIRKKVSFIT